MQEKGVRSQIRAENVGAQAMELKTKSKKVMEKTSCETLFRIIMLLPVVNKTAIIIPSQV